MVIGSGDEYLDDNFKDVASLRTGKGDHSTSLVPIAQVGLASCAGMWLFVSIHSVWVLLSNCLD